MSAKSGETGKPRMDTNKHEPWRKQTTTDYTDGHGSGQIKLTSDLSSAISRTALSMFSSKKEARESRE